MVSAPHRSSLQPRARRSAEYTLQHRAFHDLLVAPCTSEWMKRFRGTLHEHAERYQQLAAVRWDERDLDAEHKD